MTWIPPSLCKREALHLTFLLVSGHEFHPGAAVSFQSRNILWKAHLLSITLVRSCWWPHKSHVNELWERPINHHARCALPLLFMAIIGPCFLRQWLHTDGSDDVSSQPNNREDVRGKGSRRRIGSVRVVKEERLTWCKTASKSCRDC